MRSDRTGSEPARVDDRARETSREMAMAATAAVCFAAGWSEDGGRSSRRTRPRGDLDLLPAPAGGTPSPADMVVARPMQSEPVRVRGGVGAILGDIGVVAAIIVAAVLSILLTIGISQVTVDNVGMDAPGSGAPPATPTTQAAFGSAASHLLPQPVR